MKARLNLLPLVLLCGLATAQAASKLNADASFPPLPCPDGWAACIVNGMGSIGPVLQELAIGRLMSGDDPLVGMRNSNYLTLAMSVAFALTMAVAWWKTRVSASARK